MLDALSQASLAHLQLRCCGYGVIAWQAGDARSQLTSAQGHHVCSVLPSCLQMLLQHIVIERPGISTQLCTIIICSVAYNSSLDCHQLGIKQ